MFVAAVVGLEGAEVAEFACMPAAWKYETAASASPPGPGGG